MSKTAVTSPELAAPVGPYSQAIEVDGFLYMSGQVGQDSATGKLTAGGVIAETEQLFLNVAALLRTASMSFDSVISVRIFVTRMEDYPAINAIYARQFSAPFPARTTVCVVALPLGASVEMDLIARA
ncbi:RidA family protein [Sphingomonas sp.]|uniref:RidA family protein n=1 Tax=Sphingomonas sp. TaxID=28214 RepID=UPI0038A5D757